MGLTENFSGEASAKPRQEGQVGPSLEVSGDLRSHYVQRPWVSQPRLGGTVGGTVMEVWEQ